MGCPQWREPNISDAEKLYLASCGSKLMSCTDSYANIILYRKKYKTQICYCGGNVLRKYGESKRLSQYSNAALYGFPLGSGDMRASIEFLSNDAQKNNMPLIFPLLSDMQKLYLERKMPNRFKFTESRNDSDYLYLSNALATLPGGKYHKKKNHISQYMRKHPDTKLVPISKDNYKDVLDIEDKWFCANDGRGDYSKEAEKEIIKEAIELFENLNLSGTILYSENKPVAMTIASAISERVVDIHFEKAIPEYDRDGAYAVINRDFAKSLLQYDYINREEDLGIEGLRKAKLSYHPDMLLAKWSAELQ